MFIFKGGGAIILILILAIKKWKYTFSLKKYSGKLLYNEQQPI